MDIPIWLIVLAVILAFRDVVSVLLHLATGRSGFYIPAADLIFHLPIYGFLWSWF